jgi:hypothetical protein
VKPLYNVPYLYKVTHFTTLDIGMSLQIITAWIISLYNVHLSLTYTWCLCHREYYMELLLYFVIRTLHFRRSAQLSRRVEGWSRYRRNPTWPHPVQSSWCVLAKPAES